MQTKHDNDLKVRELEDQKANKLAKYKAEMERLAADAERRRHVELDELRAKQAAEAKNKAEMEMIAQIKHEELKKQQLIERLQKDAEARQQIEAEMQKKLTKD